MAESNKQQIGDGGDNPAQAAQQLAKAAKQAASTAGKTAASTAVSAGANVAGSAANATAAAAAATVNAGVQAGQAAAQIAVGTAAGGPWGAILAAAWAMRHTLFKILICVCLFLMFLVAMIVSLPSIMFDYMFGGGNTANPGQPVGIYEAYAGLSDVVGACVASGHDKAITQVKKLISDGGYDYETSMEALIDNGAAAANADISYILAAYSVSKEQKDTTTADMQAKLEEAADTMFSVSSAEKEEERITPLTYTIYKPVPLTVATDKTQTGTINGVPQYRYVIDTITYYLPDGEETTSVPITRGAYRQVTVELPIYSGSTITGTTTASYYEISGTETLTPVTETVKYLECTISSLNKPAIITAFGIDPAANYGAYNTTCGAAIEHMSTALQQTLFGNRKYENTVIQAADGEITRIGKFPLPVTGQFTLTSGFGQRIHPITGKQSFHSGIDLAGAHYCQIISIADGTVVFAGLSGDTHIVKIKHTDENGKTFYSRYLHLAEIYVREGQSVTAEQVVGTEGGEPGELGAGSSTGPHLHFELLDNNNAAYDPYDALFKAII